MADSFGEVSVLLIAKKTALTGRDYMDKSIPDNRDLHFVLSVSPNSDDK